MIRKPDSTSTRSKGPRTTSRRSKWHPRPSQSERRAALVAMVQAGLSPDEAAYYVDGYPPGEWATIVEWAAGYALRGAA